MSKVTRIVAEANLFAMMTALWSEIHNKGVNPDEINMNEFTTKYHVGTMKRELIMPYLVHESCPTQEQARKFRKEFSDYTNNKTFKKQKAVEQQLFNKKGLTIAEAIEVLKGHGYVVLKSV